MRILQIATSFPIDETDPTAPFVRSIARALVTQGHELQIVVPYRHGMPATTSEPGITVHWVKYAPVGRLNVIGHGNSLKNDMSLRRAAVIAIPFFVCGAIRRAMSIAHTWRPTVIHSQWLLPSGLIGALVAKVAGIPHIVSLLGSDVYVARMRREFRAAARWVCRNSAHVTACSNYLAAQAIQLGANPGQVHFLPLGVDPSLFRARDAATESVSAPIVLAVGRLVEKKGFEVLVNHADAFLAAHPEAELWIAGEGSNRHLLERIIAAKPGELGARIKLLGLISYSRLPDLLRLATVFVLPSIHDSKGNQDGMPAVLLEAMSCGVAAVVTDIGGARMLIEDGKTGVVVPSGDGPRLGQAIADLLSDPERRSAFGLAASSLVTSEYTWKAMATQLDHVFTE